MIVTDDNALIVYTDGSCLPHPRRGGFGIRFIFPSCLNLSNAVIDFPSISFSNATNNAMELLAVITALKHIEKLENKNIISRIVVYTDSRYVRDNYMNAIFRWQKNKWMLQNGAPVLNAELWKDFVKIFIRIRKRINIEWVKGHSKNEDNKAVDKIAKKSAKSGIKNQFKVIAVRRKKSPQKVIYGNIVPEGQRLAIRIITSEYLRVQKFNKYQYEVISKKSKYFQCVDVLYTKENMRAGHSYLVSFKSNQKIATLSKVIKEIEIK